MDFTYNATSFDQISFKFTQTHLPSSTHLANHKASIDSLAYSNTFVSIHQILYQIQSPKRQPIKLQPTNSQKQSTLKSTCAQVSGLAPFKNTQKSSFRQRIVSSPKNNHKPGYKRRLSLHIMSLDDTLISKKQPENPLHAPHPAPFRAKQTRKKSFSGKQLKTSKKLMEWQALELQSSMKVRGMVLQNYSAREKSFMRRIMQNRSSVVHVTQSITCETQIWTSRHQNRKQSEFFEF